jgi:GDP-L-fucose synthase
MRVLCTGGHGFLGGYVVEELNRRGHEVVAPAHEELDLLGDLSELERVDVIVHAAAAVGGIGANIREPGRFFYDNMIMGANVLEAARRMDAKVVSVGTACMYPEHATELRESELWDGYPAPATAPYGLAKRAVLEMGLAYREQYGLNAVMVIPTNLYGPRDNFDLVTGHVIPSMIRKLSEGGDVTLWGTGTPSRDFLFVTDAATGIVDAVERYDEPEPVNLGSGVDYSIREVAERVGHMVGFEGRIIWDTSQPDGTPHRRLAPHLAANKLRWVATTALGDGLAETVNWYRENVA